VLLRFIVPTKNTSCVPSDHRRNRSSRRFHRRVRWLRNRGFEDSAAAGQRRSQSDSGIHPVPRDPSTSIRPKASITPDLLQFSGIEPLSEPGIDLLQQLAGLLPLAALLPQSTQAQRRPQLQELACWSRARVRVCRKYASAGERPSPWRSRVQMRSSTFARRAASPAPRPWPCSTAISLGTTCA